MRYRKKPVIVEAIQYTGSNGAEIFNFVHGHTSVGIDKSISFRTLEGWEHASVGDYIIEGIHGEFYPCKPDIFEKTYELVN